MAYSFGLIGLCLVLVLSPAFYSREDAKTPLRFGLIAISCNAICSLLFVLFLLRIGVNYPHIGLALAFSLASIINASLLARELIIQNIILLDKNFMYLISRIIIASLAMSVFLLAFNQENNIWITSGIIERIFSLLFLIGVSVIIYFGVLYLLGFRFKEIRIKNEIK